MSRGQRHLDDRHHRREPVFRQPGVFECRPDGSGQVVKLAAALAIIEEGEADTLRVKSSFRRGGRGARAAVRLEPQKHETTDEGCRALDLWCPPAASSPALSGDGDDFLDRTAARRRARLHRTSSPGLAFRAPPVELRQAGTGGVAMQTQGVPEIVKALRIPDEAGPAAVAAERVPDLPVLQYAGAGLARYKHTAYRIPQQLVHGMFSGNSPGAAGSDRRRVLRPDRQQGH